MAIATNSKILCLLLLYFVQGIPYGFQARFLPIFLRTRGMSLTSLGFFKILLFPWMLKVLWSPWIDCYGTRRKCVIWSLVAMTTICGVASCISPDQTLALCIVIALLNLAASTQDIAVDGIAIEILSDSELGAGNTVQVVGYKIGSIFGGGALVWLIEFTEWAGLCILLSLFYAVTVIVIMHMDGLNKQCSTNEENCVSNGRKSQCQENERTQSECDPKLSVGDIFWQVISTPHTKWMMFLVVFYKLGEQGAVSMFPLYLVDHGMPAREVGIMTGVIGQGLSIAGSLAGGWVLSSPKISLTPTVFLPYLFKLRIIPIVLQAAIICCNYSDTRLPHGLGIAALCLLQLIGGAITTSIFTLMMQCSQHAPRYIQATHYTALATLEVIGKLMFASVAGWLVDWLGYATMFWVFVGLSVGIFTMFRPWVQKSLL